jgi:hypothetical protein
VFRAIERGGRVRATVVTDSSALSLGGPLREFVLPSSQIFTDEWAAYDELGREFKSHRRIRHAESIYVSGTVHTNTIEGFFSNLKRGIAGNYHAVSAKWLQGHLNEFVWRYNRRQFYGDRAMSTSSRSCSSYSAALQLVALVLLVSIRFCWRGRSNPPQVALPLLAGRTGDLYPLRCPLRRLFVVALIGHSSLDYPLEGYRLNTQPSDRVDGAT